MQHAASTSTFHEGPEGPEARTSLRAREKETRLCAAANADDATSLALAATGGASGHMLTTSSRRV